MRVVLWAVCSVARAVRSIAVPMPNPHMAAAETVPVTLAA